MACFDNSMCAFVTGASRGFGKVICSSLMAELKPGSVLVLLGRSKSALEATQAELSKLNAAVNILVYSEFECGSFNTEQLSNFISRSTSSDIFSSVNDLMLVHNAATVGDPRQTSLEIDLQTTTEYMNINFNSTIVANNVILSKLASMERKTVVNISSLCAVQATKSLSLYCAGKAARDMFFQVLAMEHPNIRVLNYAPGPLQTDMFDLITNTSHAEDIRTSFAASKMVVIEDSARKMIEVLKKDKFESGAHVDYCDKV